MASSNYADAAANMRVSSKLSNMELEKKSDELEKSATTTKVIGQNVISYTDKSITSVNKEGNGFGAKIENGQLKYFEIKNNAETPIVIHGRDPKAPSPTFALDDLHTLAIVLHPESNIGKKCAERRPDGISEIAGTVRVSYVPYTPEDLKKLPEAVEDMKAGKSSVPGREEFDAEHKQMTEGHKGASNDAMERFNAFRSSLGLDSKNFSR